MQNAQAKAIQTLERTIAVVKQVRNVRGQFYPDVDCQCLLDKEPMIMVKEEGEVVAYVYPDGWFTVQGKDVELRGLLSDAFNAWGFVPLRIK